MQFAQISKSTKAIWTIAVVSLALFFVLGRWHRGKVIDADVISYYSYLPAVVVHGDITMNYAPGNDFFADKVWGVTWKEGFGPVQKYTMGLSWLYAPFFLAGHGTALFLVLRQMAIRRPIRFGCNSARFSTWSWGWFGFEKFCEPISRMASRP
jgi:hypothetical protein